MKVELGAQFSPARCPFCHEDLAAADRTLIAGCADCGARAHLDCTREHGACAACGGSNLLLPAEAQAVPARARPAMRRKGAPSAARGQPPHGSSLRVTQEGTRRAVLQPGFLQPAEWLTVAVTLLLPPLGLLLLLARWREGARQVALDPDALTFLTASHAGLLPAPRLTLRREQVISVHRRERRGEWQVFVRSRHRLGPREHAIGFGALREADAEWLTEQLQEWLTWGATAG